MASLQLISLVLFLALSATSSRAAMEDVFEKVSIPPGYWQPLADVGNAEDSAFNTKETCVFLCIRKGSSCAGFDYDAASSTCTLGEVTPTWAGGNYVAEYLSNGKFVYLRKSMIRRKAVTGVPHLMRVADDAWTDTHNDIVFQDARFEGGLSAVPLPPVEGLTGGKDGRDWAALLNYYDKGILLCGGKVGTEVQKKCWVWSFRNRRWRQLAGESTHSHLDCGAVIVGEKLYLFMGKEDGTLTGNSYLEIYDFATATWKIQDAPSGYNVYYPTALDLGDGRILLVGGETRSNVRTTQTYLYHIADGTFEDTGVNPTAAGWIGCDRKPGVNDLVLCAGGWKHSYDRRLKTFNLTSKTWDSEPTSEWLPAATPTRLVTIGGELYSLPFVDGNRVRKYPGWDLIQDPTTAATVTVKWSAILVNMDYHELLV